MCGNDDIYRRCPKVYSTDGDGSKLRNNRLLMSLVQNRDDIFEEQLNFMTTKCYYGLLNIYKVAYANKILLADSDWISGFMPVVEYARAGNARILQLIEAYLPVPASFEADFLHSLKPFAYYDECFYSSKDGFDFEYALDAPLDKLLEMGYRECDCRLYEAGMTFDFDRFKVLLNEGADPYAHISGEYTPEVAKTTEWYDCNVLYDDACMHQFDNINLNGIATCWHQGYEGEETKEPSELLRDIFQGAGFQVVINMITETTGS